MSSGLTEQQREALIEIAFALDDIAPDITNSAERRAVEVVANWVFCIANDDLFSLLNNVITSQMAEIQ